MEGKEAGRSSDGARCSSVAFSVLETQSYRGMGRGCFTCSVCSIISLICVCTLLVILVDQKVEAVSHQYPFATMNKEPTSNPSFRLPKEVKPLHYDVYLHPDLANGTFRGNVTILIDVLDKRSHVTVHQKDLCIESTKLRTYDLEENHEVTIEDVAVLSKYEMLAVSTKDELHSGLYELIFEFSGALQPDKIVGFYSSKYKDETRNEIRYIATSKFEPTYARRAFPCFDEPSFKAEFTVKLVHPTGDCYSALSNMNVESTQVNQPSPGLTTVTFAKSVPMSTYLSCFIVSDFVAVTSMAKGLFDRRFPVSVYTTRAQKEKGVFALDIGVKIIEYYIDLFDVDYPLPKLDMAAIPDFVSGAMENWGLVTYREARLLYDNATSSAANMYDIVIVVAHEFAHMWFGNLVTMSWWNDLWLNEGFASFMEYKSAHKILPDWGLMDFFLIDQIHSVFVTDAKLSSHPIVQSVSNPDEITAIFDPISYKKGSSLLRMMENFIGHEAFYGGISTYLKKFMYHNAETADLLKILEDTTPADLNVTKIMDTWTRQKGYPVVNVKKSGNKFVLTQKRFLADPDAKFDPSNSEYGYKWTIPVTYITSASSEPKLAWFHKDANDLTLEFNETVDWIKVNVDEVGYYRVNYELTMWQVLNDCLRNSGKRSPLSVADRAHLLEDAFSLAEAGELDYGVAMDMTKFLSGEYHAVPWIVAASKLTTIDTLLSLTSSSSKFKKYVRDLVHTVHHRVTWTVDNDDPITRRLRMSILGLACTMGHSETIEELGTLFQTWVTDPAHTPYHPDVRQLFYHYGMYYFGDEKSWDIMFQLFNRETDSEEKLRLMRGLAGIRSIWMLNKLVLTATDETYVRSQDFFGCLSAISGNPVGTAVVWDWVRSNWKFLVNRYTLNDRNLGALIPEITKTFATKTKLNEMEAFFAKYPDAGAGAMNRAKALETVSNNIKWHRQNNASLQSWLTDRATID
ncbi:glutamyl aminopeptidase isoform X2 [Ptiloglossa arizonensis]